MGLTVMRVNLQRILRTCFVQRALLEGTQGPRKPEMNVGPRAGWPLALFQPCHLSSLLQKCGPGVALFSQAPKCQLQSQLSS